MNEPAKCQVCGEPMPPGEEMFNYHGYSGPCPKPPLTKPPVSTVALEIAARVWCDQEMRNVVMDTAAAEEIAVIVDRVRREQGVPAAGA
jgi:hypothetical protein